MAGEPPANDPEADSAEVAPEKATLEVRAENERIAELGETVSQLRRQLDDLSRQFEEFRRQFE
jgi:phage shock protein A